MKNQQKLLQRMFLLALLVTVIPACTTTTKNFQPGEIPAYQAVEQSEAASTKYALSQMMDEQGLELSQEGPGYTRVKGIVDRLSPAAQVTQPLDVYTADAGDQVNAFATGGNTIVVYDELIRRLPKDEELAVIISHEMAHLLGGHTNDDTMQNRGESVGLFSTILGAAVTVATGSDIVGDIAAHGSAAVGTGVVLSYGRAMEHEADHIGMLLMAKSDYDPKVAIEVWDKADEVLGAGGGPSFFSSHPSHGNRRERLEKDLVYAMQLIEQENAAEVAPVNE